MNNDYSYTLIVANRIKCNHCQDVIESKRRHDFVTCQCGKVSCDGGTDYLKRSFPDSPNDYTDLSETYYVYYTQSMDGLCVLSNGNKYILTGNRYIKDADYYYETYSNVWLNGNAMEFENGIRSNVV